MMKENYIYTHHKYIVPEIHKVLMKKNTFFVEYLLKYIFGGHKLVENSQTNHPVSKPFKIHEVENFTMNP